VTKPIKSQQKPIMLVLKRSGEHDVVFNTALRTVDETSCCWAAGWLRDSWAEMVSRTL